MLKKLFEMLKQRKEEKEAIKLEKIMNKPEFRLCDLYVGEIVFYKKREDVGLGKVDHHYRKVKKFAFFYEIGYNKYRHIISGQELYELGSYNSIIGDYAVHKIRPFNEVFPLFMRKHDLKSNSKVSLNFIIKNENEINAELAPEQEVIDLFK